MIEMFPAFNIIPAGAPLFPFANSDTFYKQMSGTQLLKSWYRIYKTGPYTAWCQVYPGLAGFGMALWQHLVLVEQETIIAALDGFLMNGFSCRSNLLDFLPKTWAVIMTFFGSGVAGSAGSVGRPQSHVSAPFPSWLIFVEHGRCL